MYEYFYNLSARPFQLIPDPRFLFASRDHQRALSYLLYGLQRREGFVVITGDVGMGKTLLVQRLFEEQQVAAMAVAHVAMANLDAGALLPAVASAFGLEHKGRSKIELLDELVVFLESNQSRGTMLIVDEAQGCTADALEELRVLSNMQADGVALLQIFLIGQTELRQTLAKADMSHIRQRILASHHLHSLDRVETRNYVVHRMRMVGWSDKPRFDSRIYARVHDWSGGVPRRINMMMDRILLYGFLEKLEQLGAEHADAVIDEFKAEFGEADEQSDAVSAEPAAAAGLSSMRAATADRGQSQIDLLHERVASLEHSVSTALAVSLGRVRASQMMQDYQSRTESYMLNTAIKRIAHLEQLIAGLEDAPDAVSMQGSSADASQASAAAPPEDSAEDDRRPVPENSAPSQTVAASEDSTTASGSRVGIQPGSRQQAVNPVAGDSSENKGDEA